MLHMLVFFALLGLIVFDAIIFPIIITKKSESESRSPYVFKFACYTLILIIALTILSFLFLNTVFIFDSGEILAFFLIIVCPILNCTAIYFITKKLKLIDGRGKRIAYTILTFACLIMVFVCYIFTIPMG